MECSRVVFRSRVENLEVGVVEEGPEAERQAKIDVAEGDIAIGYESSTSTSRGGAVKLITGEGTPPTVDGPDVAGADGARVHEITYTAEDGTSTTVAIADGASKTVDTQYGSLTVHSNGDWSYTSDPSVAQGASTGLSDDFTYTLIDGDGDISNVATQPITVTDTAPALGTPVDGAVRSEEHTSELQSLMRISYAVFCLKKKNNTNTPRYS